jgi:hypothetical protein
MKWSKRVSKETNYEHCCCVTRFHVQTEDREEVAEDTMAFRFDKPSGWTFKAGQYLDMTLLDPPETDSEGNVRSFSIASGPHEDTLLVATRMRDTAFKRVLKTMPLGTAVKIDGPSGDLTLQNNFHASGRIPRRRDWHYTFSKHDLRCSEGTATVSHFSLLCKPAARRRPFPRRASEPGKGQSEVQNDCQHDGNAEIPSTLEG